ncbi:Protein of unknown function [Rathayibacter oskolensis]|uniref:ABC-2 type transporter transmembrane domain-containing protein n=1 Tax=Rathayibacter oskolensis TaxID=1891671 RepID=A0A1X7P0Z6_9MICO|nr:ABC transporter permease [Rathayibacter oskolensis]SMH44270.1 Protein of unknown function [Rathayibacter oskolensis]
MRSRLTFALNPGTWLMPLVLIFGLAVLFPAVYLSATVDPQANLHGMRVGLVVEPQEGAGAGTDFAATVASAITGGVDSEKIDLIVLDSAELDQRMRNDDLAGAIVIPATFDAAVQTLLPGTDGAIGRPTIEIRTNAGDGGISSGLLTANVSPLLTGVDQEFGRTLTAGVAQSGAPTTPAQTQLLAAPFDVETSAYRALPASAGFGTSAFYYALILLLIGFVGASVVNPLVDSARGFSPSELGPLVIRRPALPLSRRHTLLVKYGVMVAAAPLTALLVELVAHLAGIPISDPVQLWALSSAAIAAVGLGALSVFALLGSGIGSLANTLFFVALSMTASGGTVPLSAVPGFFEAISFVEPFRPVLQGVRAILYFDAVPEAGLYAAWLHIGLGALVAVALGLLTTRLYSRPRTPRAA